MSRSADQLRTIAQPIAVYDSVKDYLYRTCDRPAHQVCRGDQRQFVYFIGTEDGPVKIGLTTNVRQRLESLQTASPIKLELLAYCDGDRWLEQRYHDFFAPHRLQGEWFGRGDNALAQEIRILRAAARRAERSQRDTVESQNRAQWR